MCKKYNIKKYKYIFYIYTFCLSVCLFVPNKRQNSGPKFCVGFFCYGFILYKEKMFTDRATVQTEDGRKAS